MKLEDGGEVSFHARRRVARFRERRIRAMGAHANASVRWRTAGGGVACAPHARGRQQRVRERSVTVCNCDMTITIVSDLSIAVWSQNERRAFSPKKILFAQ